MPQKKHDVFISYARANNHEKWVTEFQKKLIALLNEKLPLEPSVFLDERSVEPNVEFESDQALGGRRHSLFAMAIYAVGVGLARMFAQSNASERLLQEMTRQLSEIANLQDPYDLSAVELLFTACADRDSATASGLLDAEFDI